MYDFHGLADRVEQMTDAEVDAIYRARAVGTVVAAALYVVCGLLVLDGVPPRISADVLEREVRRQRVALWN